MDNVSFTVLEKGKTQRSTLCHCIAFTFEKEQYTPYSLLSASFVSCDTLSDPVDIECTVNNVVVHKGLVDTAVRTKNSSYDILTITSRGYTSALGYNLFASGMKYNVTLSSLINDNYTMPCIDTEEGYIKQANFIWSKENSTVWDAVVNLCLKLEENYPYIKYPDTIRFTKHTPILRTFTNSNIISCCHGYDHSRIMSHYHMCDTDGVPSAYNYTNEYATERNIIRHRHIAYDKQWLDTQSLGLSYRAFFSMRGREYNRITYKGFGGEDINDKLSYNEKEQYISAVKLVGNKNGIFTTLTAYTDSFCNT